MNISEKAADAILSKLAETGGFTVVDRDSIALIQAEKNLKFDADFNPANAPKSGLLNVCDIVVTGQIDEFSANENSVERGNYITKKTEIDGTTALKLSLRVISVETGQIIGAPTARVEQSGVLGKSSTSLLIQGVGSKSSTADTNAALVKLVDAEIEQIADELAKKIANSSVASGGASGIAASTPKIAGLEDGLVVINKGTNAGIKIGDSFTVTRPVDSGLKDPDTNSPIIRHKKLCVLVISAVDESTAEGSCAGATPQRGDELHPGGK